MDFKVGDKVIHFTYGLGEIVRIEKKPVHGQITNCYVFKTSDLTIWIPIDEPMQKSLRQPTPPDEFVKLFPILTSPGEQLQEDRVLRKNQLMTRLRDGQLASICKVIRDLRSYKRKSKLNDQERSILERAKKSLLAEWTYSFGLQTNQANQAMMRLFGEAGTEEA